MGKNMKYIGSKVNSPSFKVSRKGKDVNVSVDYFFETPTGILLEGLLKKAYGSESLSQNLDQVYKGDDPDRNIDNNNNLTDFEKTKLMVALHKFDVYTAQADLSRATYRRNRDLERSSYRSDEHSNRGYKYAQLPNRETDEFYFESTPLNTLDLERKKKSSKAKSKRKPVKKVVKKCKCKK